MRIIVDMQGAQSTGSRDRGVGRYTRALVQALLRQGAAHDVVLAFNNEFAQTVPTLRALFENTLPAQNMVIWQADVFTPYLADADGTERLAAQMIYEAFLLSLNPDIILVTSLFEGLGDGTITSIHRYQRDVPVASVLYDLIPYTNPVPYLENPVVNDWYQAKLQDLRAAELLLSISAYSGQEAIRELGLSEQKVVNISSDVDGYFAPCAMDNAQRNDLRQRLGLTGAFVMYTGGTDHRKNLAGLLRAFARLPDDILQQTQLAIVCSIDDAMREKLSSLAATLGLRHDAMVVTGFVSEQDLRGLYNLCTLFVFPSFQEGFGLPALEAIRCGAPVIGSNRSSIPEVIGCPDALFDPKDNDAMARLMARALTDQAFRQSLINRQEQHAKKFCWDTSARLALAAMTKVVDAAKRSVQSDRLARTVSPTHKKPKLAFFSPVPGAKSGISGYSAMLLPSLAQYYEIDLIVHQDEPIADIWIQSNLPVRSLEWFADHFIEFDRVVYQFGNSTFHRHMFEWLTRVPGVVVLHDFFLSGILASNEQRQDSPVAWTQALYHSHGYEAVAMRFSEPDPNRTIWQYPANLCVLQQARGMIVHTEHARDLARQWYGQSVAADWHVIPLVRTVAKRNGRESARRALNLRDDDFLVCSFGAVNPTKLNMEILQAWEQSKLSSQARAHLIFVGENAASAYGNQIQAFIDRRAKPSEVAITGWTDAATYELYLQAADVGIQLRTKSRGETSAAVLDCMNHGVATIVNAHGSMQALKASTIKLIADEFTLTELAHAIDELASDEIMRESLGKAATNEIDAHHRPDVCAKRYVEAIEGYYQDRSHGLPNLCREIGKLDMSDEALITVAAGLSQSFAPTPRQRRCLLDVTPIAEPAELTKTLQHWQAAMPPDYRLEPIYADPIEERFCFAQKATCQSMGVPDHWAHDDTAQPWAGDVIVCSDRSLSQLKNKQALLKTWRNQTNHLWLTLGESTDLDAAALLTGTDGHASLIGTFTHVICATQSQLEKIQAALAKSGLSSLHRINISIDLPALPRS